VVSMGAGIWGPFSLRIPLAFSQTELTKSEENRENEKNSSESSGFRRKLSVSSKIRGEFGSCCSSLNYPFTGLSYCLYNPFIGHNR